MIALRPVFAPGHCTTTGDGGPVVLATGVPFASIRTLSSAGGGPSRMLGAGGAAICGGVMVSVMFGIVPPLAR